MKTSTSLKTLIRALVSTLFVSFGITYVALGQSETNNPVTYDTTISEAANGEGPFTWNVRITRQQNDNSQRPAIFSIPGSGEVGTNPAYLVSYGPHYWLQNGWNGSVQLGNGTHYPILVTIQQPAANMRPWHLKAVLETLLTVLPIKRSSVHVAGLSEGSYEWGELIAYAASAGDQTAMSEIKSWVDFEGVGPGDNFSGFNMTYPTAYGVWASKYGGRFFGLEGTQDSRNIWQISQNMNASSANSAFFAFEDFGGGTHCCWNSMYDPSQTNWTNANANISQNTFYPNTPGTYKAGSNVFQWMLRQGDTTLVSSSTTSTPNTPPTVSAGSNVSITLPTSSVSLKGTVTDLLSAILTYSWSEVSGPSTCTFSGNSSISPTVSNLVAGTYVLKLTVSDALGLSASANVTISVAPAPAAALVVPATYAIPGVIQAENYASMNDINTETTTDAGGGLDVGWIVQGSWMDYNVNVATAGNYTASFRIASPNSGGVMQVRQTNGAVIATVNIPNTGDWQNWQTVSVSLPLTAGSQTLQLYSSATAGWNINWMQFVAIPVVAAGPAFPAPGLIQAENYSSSYDINTETTTDVNGGLDVGWIVQGSWMDYNVNVLNAGTYTASFRVAATAAGGTFQIKNAAGTVLGTVTVPNTGGWQNWQTVSASVSLPAGTQTLQLISTSTVGWNINWFELEDVAAAAIPGKVTGSTYDAMNNVATQTTTDAGGGLNVGWIGSGSWMDYHVSVATAGTYTVGFRVASPNTGGALQLTTAGGTTLANVVVPNTGNWQTWQTVNATVTLYPGDQNIRVYASGSVGWNFNWMQFSTGSGSTTSNPPPVVTSPALPPVGTTAPIQVGIGEYQAFFLDQTKHVYALSTNVYNIGNNTNGNPGTTVAVDFPSNLTFKAVAGALHGGGAIDVNGNVWCWGDNSQGETGNGTMSTTNTLIPAQIMTDSSGAAFTGITAICAFFADNQSAGWYAIKSDGSLWVWGQALWGMRGNGTLGDSFLLRPAEVPIPGNRQAIQVVAGQNLIVLCSDGTVWTCGSVGGNPQDLGYVPSTPNDYLSLHQINVSGIKQIAGGSSFNYALSSSGVLYGWGYFGFDMGGTGGGQSNSPLATPTDLTTRLNLPHTVVSIVTNFTCTHAILSDGTLWGWGDNANGTIGTGQELNFATTSTPYSWDFYPYDLLQQSPVQITTRNDFVAVFDAQPFVLYTYAETADGTLYSWGRNKSGTLGNGVIGCNSDVVADYPNSWDVPLATIVNPLSVTTATVVPSPYCVSHSTTSPCNECSIAAAANALSNNTTAATLSGLGAAEEFIVYPSPARSNINLHIVSDTSGVTTVTIFDMTGRAVQVQHLEKTFPTLDQDFNISNLADGVYTLQVLIGDTKRLITKFVKD